MAPHFKNYSSIYHELMHLSELIPSIYSLLLSKLSYSSELFKIEESITRVSHYQDSFRDFSEEAIIRDRTVRLHQRVVRFKSVRVPLKIVVAAG